MSKIGMVGMGKLGLPVALSIENKGHSVMGYDINPQVAEYIKTRKIPYQEEGTPELLKKTKIQVKSLKEVIAHSDIVFCPVQTPHDPLYEGITRLPKKRVDFDYSYLKTAIADITRTAEELNHDIILVIISTVLPGTIEREIKPLLNKHTKLCYNPFFIAMSTTRHDFENPEFVLLGCDDGEETMNTIEDFYHTIHLRPVYRTSIKNAEFIKVVYNTFISTKIAFINTIQEICHKTGADIDAISDALALGTDRIISPKYLRGGTPDGGGCHPRDNIALSWLARKHELKFDWFEAIMLQREKTVEWYADLIEKHRGNLPVCLCGISFKGNTNLTIGSPAILLSNILSERKIHKIIYDPVAIPDSELPNEPHIFFIGTNHKEFNDIKFPRGSVVLDPWGIIKPQAGVEIIRIGR